VRKEKEENGLPLAGRDGVLLMDDGRAM